MIIAEAVVLNIGVQITAFHYTEYGYLREYFSFVFGVKSDMPTKILYRIFKHLHFTIILHKGAYNFANNPKKPLILTVRLFNWYKEFVLTNGKGIKNEIHCV